uniref:SRCR domain-containing protein n=1 Tax=Nothobranchius korthausae TaxID=1143690 RepID=A0A1A8GR17_9TELE
MKHRDEWRPVAWLSWTMSLITDVCEQLDCGAPVSAEEIGLDLRPLESIYRCDESSLRKCWIRRSSYQYITEIICSDSVRLVNGTNRCSGRLEVNLNQSWSSVGEDAFDQQDAEVVCRELGCGPPSVLQGALFGESEAPTWSKEFQCEGNEAALLDCDGSDGNGSGKAVGLTCSDNIRLMGEASRCAGTLEMLIWNEWKPVSDDGNPAYWDVQSAELCLKLGCGSVVSTRRSNNSMIRPVWRFGPRCLHSSVPWLCAYNSIDAVHILEVICSDLLVEPQISLSSSAVGVSKAIKQGSEVPIGSDFSIMCSTKPQYQGGSFQLIFITSNSTQNSTLPAVNHFALFLFSAADHAHQGTYSCVYHVSVYSHNFWSRSQPLSLTVSGSLTDLIIRPVVVLLGLVGSVLLLYFYFKTSSSQKSGPERKRRVDGSRAAEEETAFMNQ